MRGNNARGVVKWEVGGQEFQLKFGWDARSELQEELDKPVQDLSADLLEGEIGDREIRALFWACLNNAPNGKNFSLSETSSLLEEAQWSGNLENAMVRLQQAMVASNPDVDQNEIESIAEEADKKNE